MRKSIFAVLISALAVAQNTPNVPPTEKPQPYTSADAYEVYSAFLASVLKPETTQVNIPEQTWAHNMCYRPAEQVKTAIEPAMADYISENKEHHLLLPDLRLPIPYALVSNADLDIAARDKKLRDPKLTRYDFSTVGFNPEHTIAVFAWSSLCGILCGHGQFEALQKVEGAWRLLDLKGNTCKWIY